MTFDSIEEGYTKDSWKAKQNKENWMFLIRPLKRVKD